MGAWDRTSWVVLKQVGVWDNNNITLFVQYPCLSMSVPMPLKENSINLATICSCIQIFKPNVLTFVIRLRMRKIKLPQYVTISVMSKQCKLSWHMQTFPSGIIRTVIKAKYIPCNSKYSFMNCFWNGFQIHIGCLYRQRRWVTVRIRWFFSKVSTVWFFTCITDIGAYKTWLLDPLTWFSNVLHSKCYKWWYFLYVCLLLCI